MSEVLLSIDPAVEAPSAAPSAASATGVVQPLSQAVRGRPGVIVRVAGDLAGQGVLDAGELERRLLELGFVEGARVEILHEGLFGRDPIAVRLDDMRVALRRREARAVEVRFEDSAV
ncbi:MAG: ferrous iron transport protein A [Caulobacter sp.]|nr:ferrous iron transport protein A [Caulobacter sp.]